MKKHKHKRDGRYIDDYVVEDGGVVRVPAYLADGWRGNMVRSFDATAMLDAHKPGFRLPSNFARDVVRTAREEMIDRARSGWRMDKRRPPPDEPDEDEDDDVQDARRFASREAWVASLSDQWRVPASSPPNRTTDLRRPNADASAAGPGPASAFPSPMAGSAPERPVPDDPQAKRDQAWQEYSAAISNAWRHPGPGPGLPGASNSWKGPGA
jgi:hypothetical protein